MHAYYTGKPNNLGKTIQFQFKFI